MKEMLGTCIYCGQTQMVEAETQVEADRIAAENCICDNKLKSTRQCSDNIEKICGEAAKEFGMDIVTEEVIDQLKGVAKLCVYGYIESASFRLADSSVQIRKTKEVVSVSRKKVSSVKLES